MIEVTDLSKIYRNNVKDPGLRGAFKNLFHSQWVEKAAVDQVSFRVKEGQALACIGENGAGKSTLIKMMIGILTPTRGEIKVSMDGDSRGKDPRHSGQDYLRSIGVIFGQKSNLWTDIPVIESYNAIQTLYKLDKDRFRRNFDMVVELLELAPILSSPARKLSLGQRMKSDIGMVFLHDPKLLYLDEPTIGLDINVKHTIRTFLRQMNREKGISIFLTSHDLDDIDEICEDAIVLSKGRLFYDGTLEDLKHRYVRDKMVKVVGSLKRDIRPLLPEARITAEGRTTKIIYQTEQYSSEQVLNAISQSFEIEDITIQEPDIDEVVSRIFSREA
ncbi:ABC-2 type transport system ATP-binding protein [Anaerotaenia torta]|uniref:ABC transporter ATP-binding protein n=1 Tax=Anaerotaenia torta TaxID=433293 RepID=UPI003D216B89